MTQPELEQQVARCLTQRGLTLSVAESCTGGCCPHALPMWRVRQNSIKAAPAPTAMKSSKKFSACVRRRWKPIRRCRSRQRRKWHRALRASMKPISALASPATPVPDGGEDGTPVGTIYIGLFWKGSTQVHKIVSPHGRLQARQDAADEALCMILHAIKE